MRKIIYTALLATAFTSCDKVDMVYEPQEYTSEETNRSLDGSWYRIKGKDSIIYTFQNDSVYKKKIDRETMYLIDNINLGNIGVSNYNIHFYDKKEFFRYFLYGDTLKIFEGNPDFQVYTRAK